MQSINANNYSYNSLDFSLKTSSGDTIDLSMYDERSVELSHEQSGTTTTTSLTSPAVTASCTCPRTTCSTAPRRPTGRTARRIPSTRTAA